MGQSPSAHLQEKAGLPELSEVTVGIALAGVVVRGPVFAAHVENEGIADAEKGRRYVVLGSSYPLPSTGGECSPAYCSVGLC